MKKVKGDEKVGKNNGEDRCEWVSYLDEVEG